LFKRGKRIKVWVARWRENVILGNGQCGRIHRSEILGNVRDYPTRREALLRMEDRLHANNMGRHRPKALKPFRDYVNCEWKKLIVPSLKLTTQHGYKVNIEKHLVPYFADRLLTDIKKQDIQQFVSEKFIQGFAWNTVRNIWMSLSSILESAVEYGFIESNPARGIKMPPKGLSKEVTILIAEDFKKLSQNLNEPYRTMVTIAVLTGLRIGELLALRWRVIDFEKGTLRVAESVFQGSFQKPKSERSVRTIPLGSLACESLRKHRATCIRTSAEDLVFAKGTGKPFRESSLLQGVLQPAARAAGLGKVTWHQLRHVHASTLHNMGVPAKIAQQQLGHASMQTTMNIYTHAVPETHRRSIEGLESLLFPSVPKLTGSGEPANSLIH